MSEEDNRPGLNGEEFEVTFNEDFTQGPFPTEYPIRESEVFLSHNGEPERLTGESISGMDYFSEQLRLTPEQSERFIEAWMNHARNTPLQFVEGNSPVNRYDDETVFDLDTVQRTPIYIAGIDPCSNEPNVQFVSQSQADYGTQLVYGTGGDMSEGSKSFEDLFVSSSNQPKRTDVEGYVKTNNNKELERIKNG